MTKHKELALLQSQLEETIRKMRSSALHEKDGWMSDLHLVVASRGIYEIVVREACEWPYKANILRRLAASILVPNLVYLIKVLVGTRFF